MGWNGAVASYTPSCRVPKDFNLGRSRDPPCPTFLAHFGLHPLCGSAQAAASCAVAMASSEDWSAAQIARIATLEEELALKSEALRSQGDELASVRRELLLKDRTLQQAQSAERLVQAELKKAVDAKLDLEEVVGALREELSTKELAVAAEREAKRRAADEAEAKERARGALAAELERERAAAGEQADAVRTAEAGRAAAVAEAEAARRAVDEGRDALVAERGELGAAHARRADELEARLAETESQNAALLTTQSLHGEETRRLRSELEASARANSARNSRAIRRRALSSRPPSSPPRRRRRHARRRRRRCLRRPAPSGRARAASSSSRLRRSGSCSSRLGCRASSSARSSSATSSCRTRSPRRTSGSAPRRARRPRRARPNGSSRRENALSPRPPPRPSNPRPTPQLTLPPRPPRSGDAHRGGAAPPQDADGRDALAPG